MRPIVDFSKFHVERGSKMLIGLEVLLQAWKLANTILVVFQEWILLVN